MFHLAGRTRQVLLAAAFLVSAQAVSASELDAVRISDNIQRLHMPYGTVIDPVFASSDPAAPDFSKVVGYTRAADSALWTGHYLAAEAFRYQVSRSPEALANAWRALRGIHALLDISGSGVLARCLIPADSPYAAQIQQEEGGHGIYYNTLNGQTYFWLGNTSRDQYSGVMFGLSAAYEMIDDAAMQDEIRTDVTRIMNYLMSHAWSVVMPNGKISTTFLQRPDQQLSFLQVGRRINPDVFGSAYTFYRGIYSSYLVLPILFDDVDNHSHYFKFNVNYINLYNLIHLEDTGLPYRRTYLNAYAMLRRTTENHGNAFFNMIDRVLNGERPDRDVETVSLLDSWLTRPNRDYWIDRRSQYPSCGAEDRACDPIPIPERVNTDFLWQRSPFLLFGGGFGTIETAGIDYILPYWMARKYGVSSD